MAQSSKKTIYHEHPLPEVCFDKEFLCDGCMTLGNETRYRCRHCDFDLHEYCATCPVELSSFMHQHVLKRVTPKPREECTLTGPLRICDLCRDPVEGLFYQCKICDFNVHPLCTQLPEFVWHVLHREHPLTLQPSMYGFCVFCKDVCNPWRYRCGICSFDLHLECVLKPCKEVTKMSMVTSSTTTSRSLGPQQQSSPSDLFNAYWAANIGNGAMIWPQPQPQQYFACNYGVPFGLRVDLAPYGHGHGHGHGHGYGYGYDHGYGHDHGYGYGYGYGHGHGHGHVHDYGYGHGHVHDYGHGYGNGYGHGYGHDYDYGYGYGYGHDHALAMPSTSNHVVNNMPQQSNSHVQQGEGSSGKVRKKMYAIVGNLALGVLSNVLFGATFGTIFS